jgi:C4-dicarboxylate-binding protein DctP
MKMKTKLSIIVMIIFVLSAVFAIPVIASDAKYVLEIGDNMAVDSMEGRIVQFFAKRVEQVTKGQIDVKVHPGGRLGEELELAEHVRKNTIQMCRVAFTSISPFNQTLNQLYYPYFFPSSDHFYAIRAFSPTAQAQLNKEVEKAGYLLISQMDMGFRNMITPKPVRHPDDLKGVKIRTISAPIFTDSIKAMGAIPTGVSMLETYTAIQTGVVDGLEHNANMYFDLKFYELVDSFSETRHIAGPVCIVSNIDWFKSLPSNLQNDVLQAGIDTEAYAKAVVDENTRINVEKIKAMGKTYIPYEKIDIKAFQKAAEIVYKQHPVSEMVKTIRKYINEYDEKIDKIN